MTELNEIDERDRKERTCPFCKTELLLPLYMYRNFHCPYCGANIGDKKQMKNEEAIKYLIKPVATSTKPSVEYLKQKEAYELAIKALEKPQVTVFAENASKEEIKDFKQELEKVLERPQGEWGKWNVYEIRCPECLEYFNTDCYSKEELNKCPNCGADMRKGDAE